MLVKGAVNKKLYLTLSRSAQEYKVEGDGDRGGNLGVMGVGSLWEGGEERAEDRILKGVGVRRNRKYILQHCKSCQVAPPPPPPPINGHH